MLPAESIRNLSFVVMCAVSTAAPSRAEPLYAFVSDRDGRNDVFVMEEGGVARNVTQVSFGDYNENWHQKRWGCVTPAWSPDGMRIAFGFQRNRPEQQEYEIYVVNLDGTGMENLTNTLGVDWQPDWSPDGSRIAFESNRTGNRDVYVMNADGSDVRNLTLTADIESSPAWSPDGTRIAFASDRTGIFQIYVMSVDGFHVRAITGHAKSCMGPAWSPDGTQIACWTRSGFRIVELDGTEVARLDPGTSGHGNPSWSPNGRELTFDVLEDAETIDIYALSVETGAMRSLSDRRGNDFALCWFPDVLGSTVVSPRSWGAIKLLVR